VTAPHKATGAQMSVEFIGMLNTNRVSESRP
jgi:hypothetical protein